MRVQSIQQYNQRDTSSFRTYLFTRDFHVFLPIRVLYNVDF